MDVPVSERIVAALLRQMIRSNIVPMNDVIDAADSLEEEGDDEAARVMRAMIVMAHAPSQAEWEADRRRNRFRTIDGGKADD